MSKYSKKASKLSREVWADEVESQLDYDDSLIRRCIAHGRQDIVMLVSHLSSINSQLSVIKWLLVGIFLAVLGLHST